MGSNYYIKWTERNFRYLSKGWTVRALLTEVNPEGRVLREIGIDSSGRAVYKAPTDEDNYGFFDNQLIDVSSLTNDLSAEEFESLWKTPDEECFEKRERGLRKFLLVLLHGIWEKFSKWVSGSHK